MLNTVASIPARPEPSTAAQAGAEYRSEQHPPSRCLAQSELCGGTQACSPIQSRAAAAVHDWLLLPRGSPVNGS